VLKIWGAHGPLAAPMAWLIRKSVSVSTFAFQASARVVQMGMTYPMMQQQMMRPPMHYQQMQPAPSQQQFNPNNPFGSMVRISHFVLVFLLCFGLCVTFLWWKNDSTYKFLRELPVSLNGLCCKFSLYLSRCTVKKHIFFIHKATR